MKTAAMPSGHVGSGPIILAAVACVAAVVLVRGPPSVPSWAARGVFSSSGGAGGGLSSSSEGVIEHETPGEAVRRSLWSSETSSPAAGDSYADPTVVAGSDPAVPRSADPYASGASSSSSASSSAPSTDPYASRVGGGGVGGGSSLKEELEALGDDVEIPVFDEHGRRLAFSGNAQAKIKEFLSENGEKPFNYWSQIVAYVVLGERVSAWARERVGGGGARIRRDIEAGFYRCPVVCCRCMSVCVLNVGEESGATDLLLPWVCMCFCFCVCVFRYLLAFFSSTLLLLFFFISSSSSSLLRFVSSCLRLSNTGPPRRTTGTALKIGGRRRQRW